jgi:hypothetical protein
MDFDISNISSSIASGDITNPKFYLNIRATNAVNVPLEYTVEAYPISGSWVCGTGYYDNDFEISNGVTWKYRNGKLDGVEWSNYGGDYYSTASYRATQDFRYELPNIRMDITNIVNAWISGSIPQNGIILKYTDSFETDNTKIGKIQYFSTDTHTIYIPRLEVFWDDVDVSGTASFSEISSTNYVVYLKNLKRDYHVGETPKIYVGVRDMFPSASYSSNIVYSTNNRLPFTTYYQIMDSVTDEVVVPFDDPGTKLSCDSNGNYFKLDLSSFLPERYYRIILKVVTDNGNMVEYVDDGYYFRIKRV